MKKKIVWGLLLLFIAIQFFRIDKTNPKSDPAKEFVAIVNPPIEIATMLKTSCYDCHSNEVNYPWYTNIAPVSWLIKDHINEGREHLNFSEWGDYTQKSQAHKLEEIYEEVSEGEMPLKPYLFLHSEAKFDSSHVKKMQEWLISLGGDAVKGEEKSDSHNE